MGKYDWEYMGYNNGNRLWRTEQGLLLKTSEMRMFFQEQEGYLLKEELRPVAKASQQVCTRLMAFSGEMGMKTQKMTLFLQMPR